LVFDPGAAIAKFQKYIMGYGYKNSVYGLWPIRWHLQCFVEHDITHEYVVLLDDNLVSRHPMYVTAGAPPLIGDAVHHSRHYWSHFEIACCSTHGELIVDNNRRRLEETINALWQSAFSASAFAVSGLESVKYNLNLATVGKPLSYYWDKPTPAVEPDVHTTSILLFYDLDGDGVHRGNCTAWAALFARCLDILGLKSAYPTKLVSIKTAKVYQDVPQGYDGYGHVLPGVKVGSIFPKSIDMSAIPPQFTVPLVLNGELFPWLSGDAYDQQVSVPGHGSLNADRNAFNFHEFVRVVTFDDSYSFPDPVRLDKFFDPSYGIASPDFYDYENQAFPGRNALVPTGQYQGVWVYQVKPTATPTLQSYFQGATTFKRD